MINIHDYENELSKERKRMTLEKEYQNYKENFENSEFFQTIVDYSKDIYDFKKPKISTNIDVKIF